MKRTARIVGYFIGYFGAALALLAVVSLFAMGLMWLAAEAVKSFGAGPVLLTTAVASALGIAAHGVWLLTREEP